MQRSPWKVRQEWVAKKTRAEDAAAQDPGEKHEQVFHGAMEKLQAPETQRMRIETAWSSCPTPRNPQRHLMQSRVAQSRSCL